MMSDEEKLAAKFYLKNPEFRKAVNEMYRKKAANWIKGKKSNATKVSAAGYAKRAASYIAKTGVPTAVMTAAFARAGVEAARRSGQGHHVRVLDVALTAFNQSSAVMNRDPAAFYRVTMAGAGAPIGRRATAALTRYAEGGRLGAVVDRVRGAGQAINNYMGGRAFAPDPVAVAPRGIGPAGRIAHARVPRHMFNDAINARPLRPWVGRRARLAAELPGGAPPGGEAMTAAQREALWNAPFDILKEPTKAEQAFSEASRLTKIKARKALTVYNERGLEPWMERHGPLSKVQMAKVNAKYDLAHGPMAHPDTASEALLNHGNNQSDLANHMQHGFDFVDKRNPPINPGKAPHSDGTFMQPPKSGAELPPPDTGLGGKWQYKVGNKRGMGEGLGFDEPSAFNPPPGSVRSTPRSSVSSTPRSSVSSDGIFGDTRAQDMMYDNMRLPDPNDVPGATFEFGEGFTKPTNYSQMPLDEFKHGLPDTPRGSVSSTPRGSVDFGSMPERVHTYDPVPEPSAGGYTSSDIAAAQTQLANQAANARNAPRIREVADRMNRGTTMSGKMVQAMIDKGGTVGKLGNFIAKNGRQIGGAFSIAGGALAAAGIVYGGVQLHKMHEARAQLREIANDHPEDQQIQEFFKLNDEQTKRNDVYFGLNTAAGTVAIGASALGATAAFGAGLGFGGAAAAAGVAAGPVGWAALGIGAAVWAFTSLFESGAKKRAYKEYMSKVYGSAESPSLDYYLDHKDPGLLKAVNSIKDYKIKDDATDEFKSYINGMKGDIAGAEANIKIEEGVDDPRRAQLATIMNGTVPAGELDKTSDFISRQQAQDVQQGHGPSQTWSKDDIVNHAKEQFHSDQNRYAHRGDPNLGPDLVNQTEQDHYDDEDRKNGTETHRWGYGGRSTPQEKQEETPETDVL